MKATMLFEDGSTCEEIECLTPVEIGPRHILETTHRVRCSREEDLDTCMASQFVKEYQEHLTKRMKVFETGFLSKPLPAYHFSITLDGRLPPMSSGEEEREAVVKWLRDPVLGEGHYDELADQIKNGVHLK